MVVFLLGLILFSLSAPLSLWLRQKVEALLPAAMLGIILVLYVAGLFGSLAAGFYLVLGLAAAAAVALVYRLARQRRDALPLLLTPGLAAFVILLFLIWHAHHGGRMYTEWDELCHWGLFTKNMYALDQLYNVPGSTATVHPDYPPATSLFSYFGLKLGGVYRECNAYYCANLFLYCLILPVFQHFTWKKPLPLLFLFFIVFLFPFTAPADATLYQNLFSVYVDAPLGFFFAYGLFQYFSLRGRGAADLTLVCLTLFILTVMKPIGIGFALLICLLIAADVLLFQRQQPRRQRVLWVAAPVLSALAAKVSWGLYLKLTNTGGAWDTSRITPAALWAFLRGQGEEYQYETFHNFASYFRGIPLQYLFYFAAAALCFLFFLCKPAYRRRAALFFGGLGFGYVVYSAALLVLYLFTFSSYEAVRLASIDRYIGTYYYGMFGFFLYAAADHFASGYTFRPDPCPVLLVCLLPFLRQDHLADFLLHPDVSAAETIAYRESISIPQRIVDALDLQNDRVYVIAQQDNGFTNVVARYQLTPMQPSDGPYSLGVPYDEEDAWTVTISAEDWASLLQDYTHLYVAHTDEQFAALYGSLFADPASLKDQTLYRIEKQNGSLSLVQQPL